MDQKLRQRSVNGDGKVDQVAFWIGRNVLGGSEDLVFDEVAGKLLVEGVPLVAEAPDDGGTYARRHAEWVPVPVSHGGGGGGSSSGDGEGVPGPPGPPGPQGPAGPAGPPGADSTVPGPAGPVGSPGAQGVKGDPGAQGAKGDTGATGAQGPIGPEGFTGPSGPQGPAGAEGAQGAKGDTGSQGPKGDAGVQGIQGPAGANGSPDTAAQVLAKLVTVDGTGSGLDADLLDGQSIAWYLDRANHTGTQAISTVSGLQTALDAKLADAPSDGKMYFRKNGAWVALTTIDQIGA